MPNRATWISIVRSAQVWPPHDVVTVPPPCVAFVKQLVDVTCMETAVGTAWGPSVQLKVNERFRAIPADIHRAAKFAAVAHHTTRLEHCLAFEMFGGLGEPASRSVPFKDFVFCCVAFLASVWQGGLPFLLGPCFKLDLFLLVCPTQIVDILPFIRGLPVAGIRRGPSRQLDIYGQFETRESAKHFPVVADETNQRVRLQHPLIVDMSIKWEFCFRFLVDCVVRRNGLVHPWLNDEGRVVPRASNPPIPHDCSDTGGHFRCPCHRNPRLKLLRRLGIGLLRNGFGPPWECPRPPIRVGGLQGAVRTPTRLPTLSQTLPL